MKQILLTTACLSAILTTHGQDSFEAEVSTTLPTVYVTGDIWESPLSEIAASVSVIDSDRLEVNGVQHFEDIINSIANVTWTGGTSRPRYIQMRGIGENSQFEGETPDSSVRFMIDDFDLTGLGSVGTLFDVSQVEILRGPQAGTFGANAAGGLIQIVGNAPTPYWTGKLEGTVGSDDLIAGGFAIGGPLIEVDPEKLTFRLSVNQLNQNGFRENQFLNEDDTNERDELSARFKIRWQATDELKIDGGLLFADVDNGYDVFTLTNEETDTFSDEPGRDEQDTLGGSLRATWSGLDSIDVVYIATYTTTDSLYSFDGDWSNPTDPLFTYTGFLEIDRDRDVFSEELRFNSKDRQDALGWIDRWTTGLYFQSVDEFTKTTGFGDFKTDYESQNIVLYGQGTHEFNESTRMTLGLRVEHFELDSEMDFRDDEQFDDTLFGGKLTLEHDLNQENTVFASLARGYKAGGVNIYPFLDPAVPTTYETEDLWNYEIGLRSEWLEGSVVSQVTLFYLDRSNAQVRGSSGSGISFSYFTVNGQDAYHYGAEAEVTWYINSNWAITLSGGTLETERDGFSLDSAPLVAYDTGDVSNAPKFTYSARVDYKANCGFFANAEVVGSDEYFESDSPDNRNQQRRNAYTVVNGSIGYQYENWTLSLWAKNLFDESYEDRVFFFDNGLGAQRYESPAAPQQFGVTASYKF